MTKDHVKEILDRVLTWPPERQEDAAQMLLMLEAQGNDTYRPSEDEWAAIQEGLEEAKRSGANSLATMTLRRSGNHATDESSLYAASPGRSS